MPIITNDDPPMNEVVSDGLNGLLIGSHPDGTTRSGIDAKIARRRRHGARDRGGLRRRAALAAAAGALEVRERLSWSRTVADLASLPRHGDRMSAGGESDPAPFVVGVPRSGTTLLRLMLDAHPELTIPPETHFIPAVIRACRRSGLGRTRSPRR